jgi:hypothetical protein
LTYGKGNQLLVKGGTAMTTKQWLVEIRVDEYEQERRTEAEALLRREGSAELRGLGVAQRNPHDQEVPEIGDELAVARALRDLANRLHEVAASDIEQVTHEPAHLSS